MSCVHKCRLYPMIKGCKAVIKSVMAKLFHELSTMVMEMPMGHRRSCRLTYHFRVSFSISAIVTATFSYIYLNHGLPMGIMAMSRFIYVHTHAKS